jgi:hypothetical protein
VKQEGSGIKFDELCAPSLLKTSVPSGRIAFEILMERLVMTSGSDDDRARRLDRLRQDVRTRRFASLSCVDKISIVMYLIWTWKGTSTSLLCFSSSRASLSSNCTSEYFSGRARHVRGCSEMYEGAYIATRGSKGHHD